MSEIEQRDLELAEVFGFFLSSQAITRARFNVILRILARALSQIEKKDEKELFDEFNKMFADEKSSEAEILKDYLRNR